MCECVCESVHACVLCVCVCALRVHVCVCGVHALESARSEDECDHANSVTSNVRCGLWEVGVEDEGMVNVRCGR